MNFDWILSDFEAVIPPASRSTECFRGKWGVVDYTIDGLAGKMIFANPDTGAPPITIPLPLKGTYEIIVAMLENLSDKMKIKLASERSYDRMGYSFRGNSLGNEFQEVPWRTVTLDGTESLVIKEAPGHRLAIGFIAARKVTQPPRNYKKQYLIHLCDDGYPGTWGMPEDDEDAIWNVAPYQRMGADIISLGTDMSGLASYPSRHPSLRVPTERLSQRLPIHILSSENVFTKYTFRMLEENAAKNRNIPKMFFARARELGVQTLAYSRMCHLPQIAPYDAIETRLPREHPEYRCVDIDGLPVTRLSIAFPEVRAEFIKLLTECVEMGADGINNVYNRGLPLVLYEKPVLDAFQQQHGIDMRKLPEDEPRVLAMRAQFLTAYMREQRQAINRAAGGRRIAIGASVFKTRWSAGFYGLDVATWAREGLIDMIMPYPIDYRPSIHHTPATAEPQDIDMEFYSAAVKGTSVKLIPYVNTWREGDPVAFLKRALGLCAYPIDGLGVWDPYQVVPGWRGKDFDRAVYAMSSAEAMRDCIADMEKNQLVRHEVRTQRGMKMDKYSFGWNY